MSGWSEDMPQVALWQSVFNVSLVNIRQCIIELDFISFFSKDLPMRVYKASGSPQDAPQVLVLPFFLLSGSKLVKFDCFIFIQLAVQLVNLFVRLL